MRLGVLDVGSNTVHLLIVDAHHGAAPVPAESHKIELRLAEHLDTEGNVTDEGVDRLVEFMRESRVIAEDLGATQVMGFATSAIREAANGDAVIARANELGGLDLEVLTGEDEARITFLAVRRWFGWSSGRLLVLDIGGGSLEIAVGADEEPDTAVSVPLGAGRTTRTYFHSDPPSAEELRALRLDSRATIAEMVGKLNRFGPPQMAVATSKTFKQLARIAGATTLTLSDVRELIERLSAMTAAERAELPGVSVGRAPQLLAGAVVAESAMDLLGVDRVEICPWALREGLILRLLDLLDD